MYWRVAISLAIWALLPAPFGSKAAKAAPFCPAGMASTAAAAGRKRLASLELPPISCGVLAGDARGGRRLYALRLALGHRIGHKPSEAGLGDGLLEEAARVRRQH